MKLEELNKYSHEIADAIFKEYPDWMEYADSKEQPNGESTLRIEVPSPTDNVDYPLSIDTWDDEVTVSYDYYHSHHDHFVGEVGPEGAGVLIEQLLSEEMAVASYWNGDKWRGSMLYDPDGSSDPAYVSSGATRVRIRSWKGTYDKDKPA